MDTRMFGAALALIGQIADPKGSTKPRIETTPQKPEYTMKPIDQPFPRSTPESQGIESKRVKEYLRALEGDETLDPHNVMILRNGNIIAEASYGAYDRRIWHITGGIS